MSSAGTSRRTFIAALGTSLAAAALLPGRHPVEVSESVMVWGEYIANFSTVSIKWSLENGHTREAQFKIDSPISMQGTLTDTLQGFVDRGRYALKRDLEAEGYDISNLSIAGTIQSPYTILTEPRRQMWQREAS